VEISIPTNFAEVSAEEFWHLLGNINWSREAYCGGEYFEAKDFARRRVGIHAYTHGVPNSDRYLIDPTFFKPV